MSPSILGWNERAEKMISGEAKIRDVCDVCNSGVLSELDSYGREVLVASKVLVRNYTKLNLALRYEYDRLVRWLLKLSFNSSRVDQAHSYLFEPFIPFILGEAASPVRSKIAVLAYLAEPVILSDEQLHRAPYIDITAGSVRLNPFLVRICYGAVSGAKGYVLRLNVFGPLVFFCADVQ
ncbi:hypothetical protein ACS7SF_08135 [Ralstonia sp. 25C]|uniref:hypothetical protein n=1 Tax=Ralstonia sp. 25C TaxID=3447363 RepID=UPI003F7518B0